MKNLEVRETKYGYALDINYKTETITIYFNSAENANIVKNTIERDKKITKYKSASEVIK